MLDVRCYDYVPYGVLLKQLGTERFSMKIFKNKIE